MSPSHESARRPADAADELATKSPSIPVPPAPPGELPPGAVERTRAVAEALTQLGEKTDPQRVAQVIKVQTGLDLDPAEVALIQRKLLERAATPPPLDQPPPENTRRP